MNGRSYDFEAYKQELEHERKELARIKEEGRKLERLVRERREREDREDREVERALQYELQLRLNQSA
jgi:hypothetical protein